jgi:exodeoxyribonuclease III
VRRDVQPKRASSSCSATSSRKQPLSFSLKTSSWYNCQRNNVPSRSKTASLPQYEEHFFSAVKKGYSGTAIFSKTPAIRYIDGFPDEIITQFALTGDSYGDPNAEGRIISAEFDNYWVVTCYTPNSKGDLSRLSLRYDKWDRAVLAHLKQLEATKPVLYCGDMNVAHAEIDLANPEQQKQRRFNQHRRSNARPAE